MRGRTKKRITDSRTVQQWCTSAFRHEQDGDVQQALFWVRKAYAVYPAEPAIAAELARYLIILDRAAEALPYLQPLSGVLSPHVSQAFNTLGVHKDKAGEYDDALRWFECAIESNPANAEAWNNLATHWMKLDCVDRADAAVRQAITLDPQRAEFQCTGAMTARALKQTQRAQECMNLALALNPQNSEFWFLAYIIEMELKDYDRAYRLLQQAILHTDSEFSRQEWQGFLFQVEQFAAQWDRYPERVQSLLDAIGLGECVVRPFIFLSVPTGLEQHRRLLDMVANNYADLPKNNVQYSALENAQRIRVLYVSSDLGPHPVAYLTRGLFAQHDRSRFEVMVYSTRPFVEDGYYCFIKEHAEHFVDISTMTTQQVMDRVQQDAPHIAVDLNGHTDCNRMDLFARRLAPLQVNYLGFPGTTGMPFHDYIFADCVVIPESHRYAYSEKVVWLPGSFQVNDDQRQQICTVSKSDCAIPENSWLLASFNGINKINPLIFERWLAIMRRVPNALLWLITETPPVQNRICSYAADRGVESSRIVFAPKQSYRHHLNRLHIADLVLDTLPFGGGTSTSDALWCGVPVLTCLGETFAGRMSGSLLYAAGFTELVTTNLDEYVERAVALLQQPQDLQQLRRRLSDPQVRARIFCTQKKVRHIEAAYEQMLDRWKRGLAPDHLVVPE